MHLNSSKRDFNTSRLSLPHRHSWPSTHIKESRATESREVEAVPFLTKHCDFGSSSMMVAGEFVEATPK